MMLSIRQFTSRQRDSLPGGDICSFPPHTPPQIPLRNIITTTMPYFKTSQEWLDQSTLLLEARPKTVCTTQSKYPRAQLLRCVNAIHRRCSFFASTSTAACFLSDTSSSSANSCRPKSQPNTPLNHTPPNPPTQKPPKPPRAPPSSSRPSTPYRA